MGIVEKNTMFGVDEAGKGPVMGPMVVGAVAADDESELPPGVKDSKRLSDSKRKELANKICSNKNIEHAVVVISAEEIDKSENMNDVVAEAHSKVISELPPGEKTGVVDASDTDEKRFARKISENISESIAIVAKHGADEDNKFVAAASIIAKQKREDIIAKMNETFEEEIGSGYPSDKTTRNFIKNYYKQNNSLPPSTRKSWNTVDKLITEVES